MHRSTRLSCPAERNDDNRLLLRYIAHCQALRYLVYILYSTIVLICSTHSILHRHSPFISFNKLLQKIIICTIADYSACRNNMQTFLTINEILWGGGGGVVHYESNMIILTFLVCLCLPLQAVANPQKSIRRKQRKHMLKRLAKKRQLLFHRPTGTAAAAVASRKRFKRNY